MQLLGFPSTFVLPYRLTPWPVIQNVRSNAVAPLHPISIMFQIFSQSVKTSFQHSLAVLIHYRTCVIFRFGGQCPPNSRLISNKRYSRNPKFPNTTNIRDYHPLRLNFPVYFVCEFGKELALYTTSLMYYYIRFSLTSLAFIRHYLQDLN